MLVNEDTKYQRDTCKDCKYKIICAGECEKTISEVQNESKYNN